MWCGRPRSTATPSSTPASTSAPTTTTAGKVPAPCHATPRVPPRTERSRPASRSDTRRSLCPLCLRRRARGRRLRACAAKSGHTTRRSAPTRAASAATYGPKAARTRTGQGRPTACQDSSATAPARRIPAGAAPRTRVRNCAIATASPREKSRTEDAPRI